MTLQPQRTDILLEQKNHLDALDRSSLLKARSGWLVSLLTLIAVLSSGFFALSFSQTADMLSDEDAQIVRIIAGPLLFVSITWLIVFYRKVSVWSHERRTWRFADRTLAARVGQHVVEDEMLATAWDNRFKEKEFPPDGRDMLDIYQPYPVNDGISFMWGAVLGMTMSMIGVIGAAIALYDTIDGNGPAFDIGISISVLIFNMLIFALTLVVYGKISRTGVPYRVDLLEYYCYPPVPGDKTSQRPMGTFNARIVKGSLPVIALFLIFIMLRIQSLDGANMVGILVIITSTAMMLGAILWYYVFRPYTVPLVLDDTNNPSILGSFPSVTLRADFADDTLTLSAARANRKSLVLRRGDVKGILNVREGGLLSPVAIALLNDDDIIIVVSGTKVSRRIIAWWNKTKD